MAFKNVVGVVSCLVLSSSQALADPPHRRHLRIVATTVTMIDEGRVLGGRPAGCPRSFCGCEASLYRFGRIIPELNLASNWRRFPRAAPAPGMAAVRSGHVMILQSQVEGNVWSVHDGNSGGHLTRDHVRSIAGYTIVDPGSALAMASASMASASMARASQGSMNLRSRMPPASPSSISNPTIPVGG